MPSSNCKTLVSQIQNDKVLPQTREYIHGLIDALANAKDEKSGWQVRYELQGALNCLLSQALISELEMDNLLEAAWAIWKPISRTFITERLAKVN